MNMINEKSEIEHFQHEGFCQICEAKVAFTADGPHFRDSLKCGRCKSIPRQRALAHALFKYFPNWRDLRIHESSPGWDRVSLRLINECPNYIATQYRSDLPPGSAIDVSNLPLKIYRNENLEAQTFADGAFDIVITQDVFEHLFHPDRAIREIARTLKQGGATIMTVPIVRRLNPSCRRARIANFQVEHLLEAQFHGNPISTAGSLVTVDWGYDIVSYLQYHSGLAFLMLQVDNIDLGIRAALNEVLVGFKRPIPQI